jgi:predicted transcriptional regulator
VPKENLFVSLPTKVRSQVDRFAKRSNRSRSQVVRDALNLYFKLQGVADEEPNAEERAAIAEGERAYEQGEFISLDAWRHGVGLGDQQAGIDAAAAF